MRTVLSRLIHSTPSIFRINATVVSISGRNLCTDSNKVHEPFKVEEAETVNVPPPPTEKLVVFGGNFFVGINILMEAQNRGMCAGSPTRDDGRSSLHDSWARNFAWYQGNLFSTATLRKHLNGATAVISFMSGFGSNINAIRAASDQGVKRFVYISTADFGVVNYLLQGCNIGKRAAETELLTRFPFGGVILRPGLIYETRIAAVPLEMVLRVAKQSNHIPLVGPPLTPPDAVAKVAVTAATATDPVFPPGIIDANGIQRHCTTSNSLWKTRIMNTTVHIATQTGRTDLVAKFLSACPGSIEDVTVRSETALHIAVKYDQFKALEVLVGWLQRNCQRLAEDREKGFKLAR
ncbi:hypothetical protein D0Y65_013864 [Glycine soja]|uniref:NAD(P)-binding domain-containing protein n=1 Tax=Glycine soja TaxID=3848 RepID=A0A445K5B8_GLYSO|nr:hypothetical protein D0Y65_013864 [Glycine soja]